jgi:tRNA threonylcarbamoyladenosine biosynthesis protein TsaB
MALLARERVELRDVDAFAVATGPGSFTGLRVGIATMQGLAFAGGRPLIGTSALDALALIGAREGAGGGRHPARIATWIDAWRGEVYAALYETGRQIEPPTVERADTVLARLLERPPLFIGDAVSTYGDLIRRSVGTEAMIAAIPAPLLAGVIAEMATTTVRAGHLPPPDAIRPLYVRRPDAELSRDARPRG